MSKMIDKPEYKIGQSVRHKKRALSEATFRGWSDSGKRIKVRHNASAPWGVWMVIDFFSPDNIEPVGIKEDSEQ